MDETRKSKLRTIAIQHMYDMLSFEYSHWDDLIEREIMTLEELEWLSKQDYGIIWMPEEND
jgi:hypothetical protein